MNDSLSDEMLSLRLKRAANQIAEATHSSSPASKRGSKSKPRIPISRARNADYAIASSAAAVSR